jgi:hypothetical protein
LNCELAVAAISNRTPEMILNILIDFGSYKVFLKFLIERTQMMKGVFDR